MKKRDKWFAIVYPKHKSFLFFYEGEWDETKCLDDIPDEVKKDFIVNNPNDLKKHLKTLKNDKICPMKDVFIREVTDWYKQYYQQRYIIALYTLNDDIVATCDNLYELAELMGYNKNDQKECRQVQSVLINALKHKNGHHTIHALNQTLVPYLIDMIREQ